MPSNNVPTGNHYISTEDAATMTSRYRANRNTILKETYANSSILATCETFNKAAFSTLMNNNDCKAIRIYYGMDENLLVHAIIVGVNEDNEDMLPEESLLQSEENPQILEDAVRCPQICPPESVLNED